MDIMTCPQCRRPADRPMFLPRAQQIIFDYVWEHPWCSIAQIQEHCVAHAASNLIAVQLSKIRDHLVGTPYRLSVRPGPKLRPRVRRHKEYCIEKINDPIIQPPILR